MVHSKMSRSLSSWNLVPAVWTKLAAKMDTPWELLNRRLVVRCSIASGPLK